MNLLSKIKISTFTYIFLLLSLLSGYFTYIFILILFIIIHELGHLIIASFLNFKIDKVIIYPFGGITKFDNLLNTPIYKEFLVCIFGPITQIIFYILLYYIYIIGFISNNTFESITIINYSLLSFNLLPILPLDGSKILNLILEKFFSYKLSNKIVIITSIIMIVFVCLLNQKIFYIVITLLLLKSIYKEIILYKYQFNKFLLERYLYNFNFKKTKIINNINNVKRECNHIFKYKNKYIKEKDYLRKMFD